MSEPRKWTVVNKSVIAGEIMDGEMRQFVEHSAYLEAVQRADSWKNLYDQMTKQSHEMVKGLEEQLTACQKERDDLLLDQTALKSKLAEKDSEVDQSMIGSRISELIHERSVLYDKVARFEMLIKNLRLYLGEDKWKELVGG